MWRSQQPAAEASKRLSPFLPSLCRTVSTHAALTLRHPLRLVDPLFSRGCHSSTAPLVAASQPNLALHIRENRLSSLGLGLRNRTRLTSNSSRRSCSTRLKGLIKVCRTLWVYRSTYQGICLLRATTRTRPVKGKSRSHPSPEPLGEVGRKKYVHLVSSCSVFMLCIASLQYIVRVNCLV